MGNEVFIQPSYESGSSRKKQGQVLSTMNELMASTYLFEQSSNDFKSSVRCETVPLSNRSNHAHKEKKV